MQIPALRNAAHEVVDLTTTSVHVLTRHDEMFPWYWHRHPELELTAITAGHGRRYVGTSREPFASGDVVLLGSGLPHTWASDAPASALVLHFPAELAGEGLLAWPESAAVRRMLEAATGGLVAPAEAGPELIQRMQTIIATSRPLSRLAGLIALLDHLADLPLRNLAASTLTADDDPRLALLLAALHDGIDRPLSQAAMASELGMSPPAFARWFRLRFGRTYGAHIAALRIGEACLRLDAEPATIADIAFTCGFGTLAAFNRHFRAITGMTPRAWRTRGGGRRMN